MTFNQLELRAEIANMFGVERENVRILQDNLGSTGQVARCDVLLGKEVKEFFVRSEKGDNQYELYRKVLKPLSLNSPLIYGHFETNGEHYLLYESITYNDNPWNSLGYLETAVDWLIYKDRVIKDHWEEIRNYNFIEPVPMNVFDFFDTNTDRLSDMDEELYSLFKLKKKRVLALLEVLHESQLTLVHNDVHRWNMLIPSANSSVSEMKVIDWSGGWGSNALDISKLYLFADKPYKKIVKSLYQSVFDHAHFERDFKAGLLYNLLWTLFWHCRQVDQNAERSLSRHEMKKITDQMVEIIEDL